MNDIMSQSAVCGDTELRKLRPAELYTLGQILNVSDSWKKLMAIIPKDGTGNIPKFNAEHFRGSHFNVAYNLNSMIEQAVQQQRRNAAEIFLEEWGTMGRNRPTLRTLLDFLVKAELFRAADYVAGDLLKEELPKRPECGPAAPVDISDETIRKLLEEKAALCEDEFDESLELGSTSEINVSRVIYPPDELVNAMCDSSLERNMQPTKFDSTRAKCNEIYLDLAANRVANQKYEKSSPKVQVSDLMKFSTSDINNTKKVLPNMYAMKVENNVCPSIHFQHEDVFIPACVYEKQEMPSLELPTLLHEFGRDTKETVLNQEMKTDELPVCLNNSIHQPTDVIRHTDSSFNNSQSTCDLIDLSKSQINRNEIMSFELPECILELRSNETENTGANNNKGTKIQDEIQSALASQELPITVLEYNNG